MEFVNEIEAREFHEAYERLAPKFGYETREDTRGFDPESKNGMLMVAVMQEMIPKVEERSVRRFVERMAEIDLNTLGKPRDWSVERDVFYEMFKKAL